MDRLLAVVAAEQEYAEELAAYLNSRGDFIFRTVVFTETAVYLKYASEYHIDMLLCDQQIAEEGREALKTDNICVLSENCKCPEGGLPWVFKYQSSERIMKDLITIYGRRYQNPVASEYSAEHDRGRLICICSPVGGSYKSTYALALAEYFARGGRTLFMSFDPFFTLPSELKRSSDRNLTDILYYLETYGREPLGLVEKISRQYGNLDYISGVSHWYDICDIKPEHMQKFLSAIERSDYYEKIVLDVGAIGLASMELLESSSCVYLPVGNMESGRTRINEWKRQLGFIGRDQIISKLREIRVPYDETLEGEYGFEQLLTGRMGEFIEETEGLHYIK